MKRLRNLLAVTLTAVVLIGGSFAQSAFNSVPSSTLFHTSGWPGNCC